LRMMIMEAGTTNTLHMFGSTIAAILEKGPLVEALTETGNDVDEFDWIKNGRLLKPTIH